MFEQSLVDRFNAQVGHHPERLAVADRARSLTYRELDEIVNTAANAVRHAANVGGGRVVLLMNQGVSAVVATLAALKCGAAYVPLDPSLPIESLQRLVASAEPSVLIADRDNVDLARQVVTDATPVLTVQDLETGEDPSDPGVSMKPDAQAYIYFTSGSTGKPKGVCDNHRNVLHNVWRYTTNLQIDHHDRLTLLQAPHFSGAVSSLFCALLNGAASFPYDVRNEGFARIADWLRSNRITMFHAVPAIFREVISAGDFPSLRCVRLEGDQASRRDLELFRQHCRPGAILANGLGATECGLVRQWRIDTATPLPEGPVPIGTPIKDMEILLLREDGAEVESGEIGQIAVRSRFLAVGYWRQPELTAQKFLTGTNGDAARTYLTGDLGRMLPGGLLQFLGRTNFHAKVRGQWVDVEAVEQALQGAPGIRDAVVMIRQDAEREPHIVAYVVPVSGAVLVIDALRKHVAANVPTAMTPSRWVILDRLPLNQNLKVDRAALPPPQDQPASERRTIIEPRNETEGRLAQIWAEILGADRIGVSDDFFSLGGDSLLAMQVISRIRRTLGIEVPLQALFQHPTVGGLAGQLAEFPREVRELKPARSTLSRSGPWPLSFAQQRLWFLDRFEESSSAYHIADAVRIRGDLNRDALHCALNAIVARHDILRTRFVEVNGAPVQEVGPMMPVEFPVDDFRPVPESRRASFLADALCRYRDRRFALSQGPLFRAKLFSLEEHDHVLLRVWHHIVFDGWSARVFDRELAQLYSAFCGAESASLPPLPAQYADYAVAERESSSLDAAKLNLEFWRKELSARPVLDLPTDRPRPPRQTSAGARYSFRVEGALSERLKLFNRQANVTPFITLVAAFKVLLSNYSGQEDIVIGTPVANRPGVDWENLIGVFVNTLVLRTALPDQASFDEVVTRVRQSALAAYEHQELPFEKLVEELNPARDLSRHPLFQVMFAMQHADAPLALTNLAVTRHHLSTDTTHFDLELHFNPERDGWLGTFVYNVNLFTAPTIERMAGHFLTLLANLLADPTQPISALTMLTADEERQLHDWNETSASFPRDVCLHQLVELQVDRTPDAIAVVHEHQSLSYRQLNERAERLADQLRNAGVMPDARVGICIHRSLEMFVGLLGILKAGGAYVPLDPRLPPNRLQFILGDAAPHVVVTQRSLVPLAATFAGTIVCVDDETSRTRAAYTSAATSARNAAYVMYTSGSTGRPKGVVVEHRSVVNLLSSLRTRPGIQASDVLLAVTTLSFDISVLELFLPFTVGARVVIASDEDRTNGARLRDLLEKSGITLFQATPATWKLLIEAGWTGGNPKALVGGEVLPRSLAEKLRLRSSEVWNLYGPTETTVWSLTSRVDAGPITIGTPIANTRTYIVGRNNQLLPVGVPGELLIGGDGVAREYLNQPLLTAERFISDPFIRDRRARCYRTGDRCRRREDGTIEFLGRWDDQVKIRGFRIELGEVEAALRSVSGVRDAAAMVHHDECDEKSLVGFLTLAEPQAAFEVETLREALKQMLPDYMIPQHLRVVETLPLSPSGKVDRVALMNLPVSANRNGTVDTPQTLLELKLLLIWQRLFQRADIGRDDDFFELGGYSLMAARMAAEMETLIGRRVPVVSLFRAPTVTKLAQLLQRESGTPAWSSLVPLQASGSSLPLFCVHGWGGEVHGFVELARELSPDRPVYGIQAIRTDEHQLRHANVEQMAGHYAREIRSLEPHGPYHILGHSLGGWVAFAVAQQLSSEGASVATLGVLDTEAMFEVPWTLRLRLLVPFLARRLRLHAQGWKNVRRGNRLQFLAQKVTALQQHVVGPPPSDALVADDFARVVAQYRPNKYAGTATLFVVDDSKQSLESMWRYFARGGVEIRRVPGTHHTLIDRENAADFACILREVLRKNETLPMYSKR